ncbi:MAG: hypothetical protein AAFQ37_10900 [Bacteroidota bacterium]
MKLTYLLIMASLLDLGGLTGQSAGDLFPQLTTKDLTKKKVVFPDDLEGEVNILILVFQQRAQLLVNTWADFILSDYEPQANITYYEIPMMSSASGLISWQVDNWMRAGIPAEYHDNTACFYGNRRPYFKALEMNEIDSCYIFLVGKDGQILWRENGKRTDEKEASFRKAVERILSK